MRGKRGRQSGNDTLDACENPGEIKASYNTGLPVPAAATGEKMTTRNANPPTNALAGIAR